MLFLIFESYHYLLDMYHLPTTSFVLDLYYRSINNQFNLNHKVNLNIDQKDNIKLLSFMFKYLSRNMQYIHRYKKSFLLKLRFRNGKIKISTFSLFQYTTFFKFCFFLHKTM